MSVPNATCATATVIPALPFAVTTNPTLAGEDLSAPSRSCGAAQSYNAEWYVWTAPLDFVEGEYLLDLLFSDNAEVPEAVAAVFSGSCGALVEVACAVVTGLQFYPAPGATYYILLTLYDADSATSRTWSLDIPQAYGDFCADLTCAGGGAGGGPAGPCRPYEAPAVPDCDVAIIFGAREGGS